MLYATRKGELRVHPTLRATAQSGWEVGVADRLIALPSGTTLMHLPGRRPLGRSAGGDVVGVDEDDAVAVAAHRALVAADRRVRDGVDEDVLVSGRARRA